MIDVWLEVAGLGATVAGGLFVAVCLNESARPEVVAELRFGTEVTEGAVRAVLSAVSGMPLPTRLTFEVVSDAGGIRHFVRGAPSAIAGLTASVGGLLPGCQLVLLEDQASDPADFVRGLRLSFRGPSGHLLLRTDQATESSTGLLAAISGPLGRNEQVLLRIVVRPSRVPRLPEKDGGVDVGSHFAGWLGLASKQLTSKAHAALANKYAQRPLRVSVLVVAKTATDNRAWALLGRISSGIRARHGLLGRVGVRRLSGNRLRRALMNSPTFRRPAILSVDEMVGLLAWPIEGPVINGLRLGVAPLLAPPRGLQKTGRMLAKSDAPGHSGRSLAQPVIGGLQHMAVIGPTGSGKSALALNLIHQDVVAGRGVLVVDVKGDLVTDLLERIPANRSSDVIVLDPAHGGAQPGLQLFDAGGGNRDAELTADLVLGTLREMFKDSWGIRTESFLRLGLLTLAHLPGASLPLLPRLFGDVKLRTRALANAGDPWLTSAWQRFEAMSRAEQQQQLAAPLSKLEQLVGRKSLRQVLGQANSRLDFDAVLAKNQIVLVRLPQGLLGRPATQLLASLTLWQFFAAVEGRASLNARARRPFFAYVDEIGALGSLPLPLGDLLERARGFGVGVTLLPQSLSQLPQDMRRVLSANVGSLVSFRQSSLDEAKSVAGLLPGMTPEQLQHLEPFAVAMRLALSPSNVSPVMTGLTLPPAKTVSRADGVRRNSAERYGLTLAEVDHEFAERWQVGDGSKNAKPASTSKASGLPGQSRRSS